MNTYEVPVWFTINAKDQHAAWAKIIVLLDNIEKLDQLPEYNVEEPVEVLPPLYDYNPVGAGRT